MHAATENLGDRLIVDAIRDGLRARLPELDLVFESASPGRGARGLALGDFGDRALRRAARGAVEAADLVLLGGGELIGHFYEDLGVALLARAAGRPALWLGVGGRIDGAPPERWYTRRVLAGASCVVTRDSASFRALRGVVPGERLHDGVDVAFGWRPPEPAPRSGRREFGLCLRGPERRNRVWDEAAFRALARGLRGLVERGWRPVLFTFLTEEAVRRIGNPNLPGSFSSDEAVHDLVRRELGAADLEVVVANEDPAAVARRLGALDVMVGMRLHSLILAALCGVPLVALDYAPKVAELARGLGCEDALIAPAELETKLGPLLQRLEDAGVREARRAALGARVAAARERALHQLDLVTPFLEAEPAPRRARPVREAAADLALRLVSVYVRL